MWLELGRRISMIMLIVAVATGLSAPVFPAEPHHGQRVATVAMSADNLATCAHRGCPLEQRADMHGSCFAACAGVSIVPSPTAAILYYFVGADVLRPKRDLAMVGQAFPPDPHPPKS
jgi:hypothetical protein